MEFLLTGVVVLVLLALVALPLLLVGALLGLLLKLMLLPFKLLGWAVEVGLSLGTILLKAGITLLGLLALVVLCLVMSPLLPLLLIAVGLYFVLRSPRAPLRPVT